ncbi:hypothetical protein CFN78_00255 [Amycolatopsis antarctica]|uniref:Calcineurin-like phosphoesterase domain-containing protein n=1 Tax=Amycolatopsis antarctica TaxID=1854586 RepID=A0A263DB44_9PSEU|nr:metallophosphoesterase [Amycolatopsis antarctica]OZM74716.1 hypothetical protein CFN78_00255 [Amycolatopsis antarctica]
MFIVVVGALVALLHLYLWKRLVRDTTSPGRARRLGTVLLIALVLVMFAALTLGTRTDPDIARWYAWPGYLWLAVFFYLLLILLVLELPRLALRRWVRGPARPVPAPAVATGSAAAESEPDTGNDTSTDTAESSEVDTGVSRRMVLARGSALLAGVASTALVGYGATVAMSAPKVTRVAIPLRRLDPRVAGFRIALISDVHLGPLLGRSFTERIVDIVNAERPDAVAIVGDLVDGSVEHLAEAAEPLRELRSPAGTFFVTGNHEYYSGYTEWVEYVRTLGIRPLRNERVTISRGGGTFQLAGVNDATADQFADAADVGKALLGRNPAEAVVLLAHQPVSVDEAVANDVDLQLSGHTHGGQITPFELAVSLQQGAVAGLSQVENTKLYVTRGAGFWGPPVRIGADPDISIVELRSE